MDEFDETSVDSDKEQVRDRGIPSVAREPKGQIVFMGIFVGVAIIAIILVVMAGMKKDEAKSKVAPVETVFKSPASNGEPYIQPEAPSPPPQKELATPVKPEPVDTAAAQREMMMQQEALRMAAEERKRKDERLKSPQVILDEGRSMSVGRRETPSDDLQSGGNSGSLPGETSNDSNLAFADANSSAGVEYLPRDQTETS